MSESRKSDPPAGEFSLIARHFAPLAQSYAGAMGLLDDAAFIAPNPGHLLAVTTDTIVEGIHYLSGTDPALVAAKLVRVNLSDLAAKGAKPFAVTLNLAIPKGHETVWLEKFARGLADEAKQWGFALIGGDTVSIPGPVCLGLTAFGWCPLGRIPHRSGAQAGDQIWVSGRIGLGGLGLLAAQGIVTAPQALDHYTRPKPRLELGRALAPLVHAAMDLSDGLIQDLGQIAHASGLGAEILADAIPLGAELPAAGWDVVRAAQAGDDYELLVTASQGREAELQAAAAQAGLELTRIGVMVAGQGIKLLDENGNAIPVGSGGWDHFGKGAKR